MMIQMDNFWVTHSKSHTAIQEHKGINERLREKLQDIQNRNTSDTGTITTAEDLIRKHKDYYEELQVDSKEFIDASKEGVPTLFSDNGELKSHNEWMKECRLILQGALEVAKDEDPTLEEACEHLEKMIIMEIATRNAVEDADTYLSQEYLDQVMQVHLWFSRA